MSKREDYAWLNKKSRTFLKRGYIEEGQTAEERIRFIAEKAEEILGISGFADRFEHNMKRGWYSLASPVWSNFGTSKGLPISCNGSYIDDSMNAILEKTHEVGIMTKHGAGTSAYFGDIRPRGAPISKGGTSNGPVNFMQLYNVTTNVVSQANVRRGSMAAYLPVEHPDILEFLQIKDTGNPIQNLSIGVCITDEWMNSLIAGNKEHWKIWGKIIEKRYATGYPYIFFTDNANNNKPQVYKDKNMKIHASNLCTEIFLPSSSDESFVCNLSSMNQLYYDEWKETDAVEVLIYFLDAVMTEYIEKTSTMIKMECAHRFAKRHRALGLGTLGWHSYLQSKMIAFESFEAKRLNIETFRFIRQRAEKASRELAELYGEPEVMKGYGMRNSTLMAIAPTTSSSFILGQVSPSIEPLESNYFVNDLAKGNYTYKNPYLRELLKKYDKNDKDTWMDILVHGGSVQHLGFLTQHEKDVFKTFQEISQKEHVIQAIQRQGEIDQGQSLNLKVDNAVDPEETSRLIIFGWQGGVKSFYYQRGTNAAQQLSRSIMSCTSCEA